jgi:hypothetical protein
MSQIWVEVMAVLEDITAAQQQGVPPSFWAAGTVHTVFCPWEVGIRLLGSSFVDQSFPSLDWELCSLVADASYCQLQTAL